jgi:hypothetical protein
MFQERTIHGILFIGDTLPGNKIKNKLVAGDSVTLEIKDQRVFVKNVLPSSCGKYTGRISGFDPSDADCYEGLRIDQAIEFFQKNIFSATNSNVC